MAIIQISGNQKQTLFQYTNQEQFIYTQQKRPQMVTNTYYYMNWIIYLLHKLNFISDQKIQQHFSINSQNQDYFKKIYTYLTHSITHTDFLHLVQNVNSFQNFASPIEQKYGSKKLFKLMIWGAIWSGLAIKYKQKKDRQNNQNNNQNTIHFGASGLLMCLTFYCIMKFPRSKIGFQTLFIPSWLAGIFMILQDILLNYQGQNQQQRRVSHIGHLGGIIAGIMYYLIFDFAFDKQERNNSIFKQLIKFLSNTKNKKQTLNLQTFIPINQKATIEIL